MELVRVQGGLHRGWCRKHARALLNDGGIAASAPEQPCKGENRNPLPETTLAPSADALSKYVRARRDAVLVAHSIAGPVISEYEERVPDHFLGLVLRAADLVPSGTGVRDAASCDPVATMDCDHSPFLTGPQELAAHLASIAHEFH